MPRPQWQPTVEDFIRLRLYMADPWLYDCPVCGHAQHEGLCTRTVWAQPKGIS
jgi:hypothetical protein